MSTQAISIAIGIVLYAALIAFHYIQKDEIASLKAKLAVASTEITTQNAAIQKAHDDAKKIQTLVDVATQRNLQLQAQTLKSLDVIEQTPVIADCAQATSWGAKQAAQAALNFQTAR